jgi:UDP-hydrolysing UDP-N-acetyl-D-glucosamine 2-epimerase
MTATRAEYGYLKWLMADIQNNPQLELLLIVTGAHLCKEQGYTVDQIKSDGFKITKALEVQIDNSSSKGICKTMVRYGECFIDALNDLTPDCLVVLGDRYELLPICSTAFMMKIPIVHLCGGDVTEGALDDGVRNSVTMMADYHFPLTKESAENIKRMLNSDKNIYTFGSTSLDIFNRIELMTKEELAESLNLDVNKKWILCTLHAETKESVEYNSKMAANLITALNSLDNSYQVIITKANTDLGGIEINNYFETVVSKNNSKYQLYPSLGQLRYVSFMKQVKMVIGNSSSGILESPFLSIPTVNIGNRQKGRYLCSNVVQSAVDSDSIIKAINKAFTKKIDKSDLKYYGDGNASHNIMKILEKV